MKKHSTTILSQFDESKFLLHEFGEITFTLIKSLIKQTLRPHQINFRVKDRDSLANKLIKKNNKYTDLNQITDLVGLRIITYFEDDIDKVAEVFEREFNIDLLNSVDKREIETDRFGYRSLHYVAALNESRANLTEYRKYKEFKFEVQIRSILQHSWAEIEHDLGYKGENEIPTTAKRTFYRVAALLEQADIEFVKLRQLILEHESAIKQQILTSSPDDKIDNAAIIAFIKESTALNDIEKEIESLTCERSSYLDSADVANNILNRLNKHKINTLYQLESLLSEHRKDIIKWNSDYYYSFPEPRPQTFIAGASLIWLLNYLEDKTPNYEELHKDKRIKKQRNASK